MQLKIGDSVSITIRIDRLTFIDRGNGIIKELKWNLAKIKFSDGKEEWIDIKNLSKDFKK